MKTYFTSFFAFALAMVMSCTLSAQVTTASLNGQVSDANETLIGANVFAVHTPTGSTYGVSTDADGYFRLSNMRVGGPYTLTVSYTGYEDYVKTDLYLSLGQSVKINVTLAEAAVELETAVVLGLRNDIFDGNKTGTETVVDERALATLPTLSRSIGDFARTTASATVREGNDGFSISIGGMNNRYNSIYIDGAVNNDVFGLAGSGTNGGQTGVTPFSLDAISELQISVAPFDVRQGGFAGGAINAVTRSGTNSFKGSVYTFFRNEKLAGDTPTDIENAERTPLNEFTAKTTGFRLGGPLIKNKLFFFVNAELQDDQTPQPFDFATYEGDSDQAALSALEAKLNGYGYDPGTYTDNLTSLASTKVTVKFDYNLNKNNKLSFRHGYVDAENVEGVQSGTRAIRFLNSSEFFRTTTNTSALELSSIIGSSMANNLKIGYIAVVDDRDPLGDPFPYVRIDDGDRGAITFGSERFSTANQLEQNILTINNNFEIYKGKHTFTLGAQAEFYKMYNLFIPFNYGSYEFNSLEDFMTDQNSDFYIRSYSLRDNVVGDGSLAGTEFTASTFNFYVQDEIQMGDFKLTAGVRIEAPVFGDTPVNKQFNDTTIPLLSQTYDLRGARTGQLNKTQVYISPRIGFNWDISGDRTMQIRGGIGVFTSRMPLVWPGGAYNNTGVNRGTILRFGDLPFNPDYQAQIPGDIDPNNISPNGDIDLFAEDLKVPQVLKANITLDKKLPWGMIGNIDLAYNKTLNNVAYQNVNLKPAESNLTGTGDNRPIFNRRDEIDDTYGRIILGYNTTEGYTYNVSASLTKPFSNGFSGSLSYSYGDAYTIFDGTSSQNSSQWRGLHAIGGRNFDQVLARSDFAQGHRVILGASYGFDWFKTGNIIPRTTFSIFFEGITGQPYSYVYNNGRNIQDEDSRRGRTLIYVPTDANDIVLVENNGVSPAEQWADLDAFISQDEYLSTRRGQYAERNASTSPFTNVLDFKFIQDVTFKGANKSHTLQLTFDIFNFGNLINPDWGRRYFVPQNFNLLNFRGFQEDINGDPTTVPTFTYGGVTDNDPSANNIDDSGIQSSRWQMQVGVRYIFE